MWVSGFLIIYLPLMWDWIPTDLAHRYYCKKEAGLWIYKTLDQWKAENPGVYETLVYDGNIPFKWVYDNGNEGKKTIDFLNKRVGVSFERKRVISFLILEKYVLEVIDLKNSNVLAKYIDFNYDGGKPALGTGYKIWMAAAYCPNGSTLERRFFEFERLFKGAEK